MMLGSFLLIGLILFLIFRNNGMLTTNITEVNNSRRPLEILKERYAKGEIDTEEYNLRKAELEKS